MIDELAIFVGFGAVLVAAVALATALATNKLGSQKSVTELTFRIIAWLSVSVFFLTLAGCIIAQQVDCAPDDDVCDGPALAAAGIVMLGSMIIGGIVLLGTPIAYGVLKLLRPK